MVGEDANPQTTLPTLVHQAPNILLLDLNLHGSSSLMLLLKMQHHNLVLPTIVLTMSAHPHQVSTTFLLPIPMRFEHHHGNCWPS
ncbi:MAG: hypothetical protein COW02_15980 [Comamonadaceae bacterium CG12_big_fil_rev_8_21_14_0_65_59_15]|nr:MAG: hypothetical protein COW02_15980 [Comamonadaceae bacterium CG12_big_fil_rev_8_21_14_0_65_59_15]